MDYDIIDGKRVEQVYIRKDTVLSKEHEGTINIFNSKLEILSEHKGTLNIVNGYVNIKDKHIGTTSLVENSELIIFPKAEHIGTLSIDIGSKVIIEEAADLIGTVINKGKFVVKGNFKGNISGDGETIFKRREK